MIPGRCGIKPTWCSRKVLARDDRPVRLSLPKAGSVLTLQSSPLLIYHVIQSFFIGWRVTLPLFDNLLDFVPLSGVFEVHVPGAQIWSILVSRFRTSVKEIII